MRLTTTLIALTSLTTLALGDTLVTYENCLFHVPPRDDCTYTRAEWISAFGTHPVDARDGCRNPSRDVPGMWSICVDWARGRGHFYFEGQDRRCFVSAGRNVFGTTRWPETGCSWREMEDGDASESGAKASNAAVGAAKVERPE